MNNLRLVMIEWVDSHSSNRWEPIEAVAETAIPLRCFTVGHLVRESKTNIVVVGTISRDENGEIMQATGNISIPKRCVTKKKFLT